jgi:rhodanese-related sulfurtransferase
MTRVLKQCLWISLLAAIPAVMASLFHPHMPSWSASHLADGEILLHTALHLKKKTLWIDARNFNEFQHDHIPGAVLLNENQWDILFPKVLQQWKPEDIVIVYCNSQNCTSSHQVARRLHEMGIMPVYILKGGWEAWLQRIKS